MNVDLGEGKNKTIQVHKTDGHSQMKFMGTHAAQSSIYNCLCLGNLFNVSIAQTNKLGFKYTSEQHVLSSKNI